MSVLIVYCRGQQVDGGFHDALNALQAHERFGDRLLGIMSLPSGPRVAAARNHLVRGFLQTNADRMLMLDTDVVFPPDLIDQLDAIGSPDDVPIASGLYFARGSDGVVRPLMMVATDQAGHMDTIWDYPPDSVLEVDAVGAGCLYVTRPVLEHLACEFPSPGTWFAEARGPDGEEYGEDVTFCLRARGLGYKIVCHTGIQCSHMKVGPVDETDYLAYRRGITALGEEGHKAASVERWHRGGILLP